MRIRQEDIKGLPPHLRTQIEAELGLPQASAPTPSPVLRAAPRPKAAQTPTPSGTPKRTVPLSPYSPKKTASPKTRNLRESMMSGAEKRYQRDVLKGAGMFEAITLRLPGGSRYTADFLTIDDDGVPTLHEVKGSFRLGSEGRAHTAFHEAAAQFSSIFRFVWAVLEKGGRWNVKATIDRPSEPRETTAAQDDLFSFGNDETPGGERADAV